MKSLYKILTVLCDWLPPQTSLDRISLQETRRVPMEAFSKKEMKEEVVAPVMIKGEFFPVDHALQKLLGDSRGSFARVNKENFDEKLSHRLHFLSFL